VPHDDPLVIHEYLTRSFAKYAATHPAELRETRDPDRELAGRQNTPAKRTVSGAQWVAERVAVAEELLWHKTCAQCHAISGSSLRDVHIARWEGSPQERQGSTVSLSGIELRAEDGSLPLIAAARVKLQWMPHARFDHDAHTGFSCAGCHANALKSTESSDVLIPGIAVCQTCHASGPGHASAECSECHTYHDWSKRKEVKPVFTLPALRGGS
jgi:hypothetical protein